ncbi:MAG: hypothetical protein NKF70_11085 [Methanobacterium sp. ERen5]|nr:MAG: hypothetical protein NKF70_11085 [Methanobacterium sp. ERen5]
MVSVTYENGQQIHFMAEYIEQMELPQILGEGQAVFYSISAEVLATLAFKNEHMGIVKVSGIFKTADKKIYKTKSIDLNIDKYKMD